jgi:Ca2+-binding RTX toxin-like protein
MAQPSPFLPGGTAQQTRGDFLPAVRHGGGADAVLVGGDGDNLVIGTQGRDVLLGGFAGAAAVLAGDLGV